MKIVFNRQDISNKIAPLMNVVSNKGAIPAAEGILIEANSNDRCTLTAFDTEKGIRINVEADVLEQGSYIINAQKFNQTLKVMDGEEIILTVDSRLTATFECGKSTHKTGAMKAEEFPEIPDLKTEKGFTVKESTLKNMLSKVSYAMGVNEPRPVLNGCFVKTEENKINMVACDGFKLAICTSSVELKKLENKSKTKNAKEGSGHKTAVIISEKFHISPGTAQKYYKFYRCVESIRKKSYDFLAVIFK